MAADYSQTVADTWTTLVGSETLPKRKAAAMELATSVRKGGVPCLKVAFK